MVQERGCGIASRIPDAHDPSAIERTCAMGFSFSGAMGLLGGTLLFGALIPLGAFFMSMARAWRNGLPWWSGGLVWFRAEAQPPAARPHMRAAMRRFGLFALCGLGAVALLALAEG